MCDVGETPPRPAETGPVWGGRVDTAWQAPYSGCTSRPSPNAVLCLAVGRGSGAFPWFCLSGCRVPSAKRHPSAVGSSRRGAVGIVPGGRWLDAPSVTHQTDGNLRCPAGEGAPGSRQGGTHAAAASQSCVVSPVAARAKGTSGGARGVRRSSPTAGKAAAGAHTGVASAGTRMTHCSRGQRPPCLELPRLVGGRAAQF